MGVFHQMTFAKAGPLALGTTLALAVSSNGAAQFENDAVSQEGANTIAKAITKALGDFASSLPVEANLVMQSPVDVVMEADTYSATIPALGIRVDEGDERYELQLEPTQSSIDPLGGNRLKTSIDLPEQIVGSRNEVPMFQVDWATQIAELIFNSNFGFAEQADVKLTDIAITDLESGTIVGTAAGMSLLGTYDGSAGDSFDGEATANVTGIEFIKPDGGNDVLAIGEIEVGSDIQEQNIAKYHAFRDLMTDIQAKGYMDEPAPSSDARQIAKQLVTFLDAIAGTSQRAIISDFFVSDDDFTGGFGLLGAGLSLEGLNLSETRLGLNVVVADPVVPAEGPYEVLVPTRSEVSIALSELPSSLLAYLVEQAVYAQLTRAQGSELGTLFNGAADSLLTSGAVLDVESGSIEFDDSAIFTEGQFRIDHTAPFFGIAEGTIRLVGAENLIEKIRPLPDGDKIAAFLALIQLMGAEEQGADGIAIRRYDFELTAEGQILINGTDIGPIIGQL